MSLFVDTVEREGPGGTWAFNEPTFQNVLGMREILDYDELPDDTDELEISIDDLDFGALDNLMVEMIHDWPEDEEVSKENIRKLRREVYEWLINAAVDVITEEGHITEDEEKNSEES